MSLFYEDDIFIYQCTNLTYATHEKILTTDIYIYYTHLHCKMGLINSRVDARATLVHLGHMLIQRRPNTKCGREFYNLGHKTYSESKLNSLEIAVKSSFEY